MAHSIKITYTAPVAPEAGNVAPICRCFEPNGCAADKEVFAGTYYDTNVDGWGVATTFEAFMQSVDAHPGLVAILRSAIRNGEATMDEVSDKEAAFFEEIAPSLVEQGFEIEVE